MDLGHKETRLVLYGRYEDRVPFERRGVIIFLPSRMSREATRIFNKAYDYYDRTFNTDTFKECVEKVIEEENWDTEVLAEEEFRCEA